MFSFDFQPFGTLPCCVCSPTPTSFECRTRERGEACPGVEPWSQVPLSVASSKAQQGQHHEFWTEDDGLFSALKSLYVLHLTKSSC
jgi:hypothetical protein